MNKKNLTIFIILILILGGAFVYFKKQQNNIVPEAENVSQEIDTSDWETFRDEELGIEFKYPGDWQLISLLGQDYGFKVIPLEQSSIDLDYGEVYLRQTPNLQNLSIEDLFHTFSDTSNNWFDLYQYENISINGLSGIFFHEFQEEGSKYRRSGFYLQCDKRIISIDYIHESDNHFDIFHSIANSLSCYF